MAWLTAKLTSPGECMLFTTTLLLSLLLQQLERSKSFRYRSRQIPSMLLARGNNFLKYIQPSQTTSLLRAVFQATLWTSVLNKLKLANQKGSLSKSKQKKRKTLNFKNASTKLIWERGEMVRQMLLLGIINKLICTTFQVTVWRLSFHWMLFPHTQDKLKETAVIPHQQSSQADLNHIQTTQHWGVGQFCRLQPMFPEPSQPKRSTAPSTQTGILCFYKIHKKMREELKKNIQVNGRFCCRN